MCSSNGKVFSLAVASPSVMSVYSTSSHMVDASDSIFGTFVYIHPICTLRHFSVMARVTSLVVLFVSGTFLAIIVNQMLQLAVFSIDVQKC